MKKYFGWGVFILLIAIIAIAAALKKTSDYDLLKNDWKYVSITDKNGETVQLGDNNFLSLTSDFHFSNTSPVDTNINTGLWRLNDSIIVLTVDYSQPADSIVYDIKNNTPAIEFYNSDENIATIRNNKLTNKQFVEKYKLISVDEKNLVIEKDGYIYKLVKVPPKAAIDQSVSLDFSFNAIWRGLLGMLTIIGIAYLFSTNRKAVSWRVVIIGLISQVILAIGILKVPAIAWIFETVGRMFVVILDFTRVGSEFLLGDLMNVDSYGFIFAFQVLPTIIFFSALTSLLFYLGIIQKIVYALAWLLTKMLKISGAESLSVAGNIFLGQTESPLLIKAYLEKMNKSEIMLVMSGGMATLAGGVLASYIAFLGGTDPVQRLYFAKHLIAASVMAAPGVIVLAKIIVPQTEPVNKNIEVSKEKIGSNILDAITNGTTEGLKLSANVAAMLLTFIAFIAMTNFILMKIGGWTGLNEAIHNFDPQYKGLDLKFILGYIFAPIVWLMGVAKEDITLVGRLLGEKLIMTEFVAYISLADLKEAGNAAFGSFASQKSIIMSTYALCGFANFASIGIQIGGIGTLAPGKRKTLSELGMRALLAGSLASMLSATIVGMILG